MKPCSVLPHPAQDVDHPSLCPAPPHCVLSPPGSHLATISVIRSQLSRDRTACVQVPLFYLIMASTCKGSDAGNSDTPKRSPDVYLCIRENSISRVWYYLWFQAPTGGVGTCPLQRSGETTVCVSIF